MAHYDSFFWLGLNIVFLIVSAFYSMMEMACVSFNRVRLHYYVSKGDRNALLLNQLLHHPSKLFGTTLIAVNLAMFIGSECAREFHISIGVNPDLAPLTQVIVVIIFGELAPMFAARSYSEHVAMLGIPLVHLSSKLLIPALWILDHMTQIFNALIKSSGSHSTFYLTQEELQKILEEQEGDQPYASNREHFNTITSNIFSLRQKEVGKVMVNLAEIPMVPSNCRIEQARKIFATKNVTYLPIYHNEKSNIIAIAFPRDLVRASDQEKVREFARVPWFVTENVKLPHMLKQFRSNKQEVAVILDIQGHATGMIYKDEIIEEVFSKTQDQTLKVRKALIIDRTFPGSFKVADFNAQFDVELSSKEELTLEELIEFHMGYQPEEGESIYLDPFEISVKETSLLGIKTVSITTKIEGCN